MNIKFGRELSVMFKIVCECGASSEICITKDETIMLLLERFVIDGDVDIVCEDDHIEEISCVCGRELVRKETRKIF